MKLLVFDDDKTMTSSMRRSLKSHFDEVFTSNDIDEAITLLDKVDVVLSDWNAPSADDGQRMVETCKERGIKVVILSAIPPYHMGVATVTKPASTERLLEELLA